MTTRSWKRRRLWLMWRRLEKSLCWWEQWRKDVSEAGICSSTITRLFLRDLSSLRLFQSRLSSLTPSVRLKLHIRKHGAGVCVGLTSVWKPFPKSPEKSTTHSSLREKRTYTKSKLWDKKQNFNFIHYLRFSPLYLKIINSLTHNFDSSVQNLDLNFVTLSFISELQHINSKLRLSNWNIWLSNF